MTLYATGDIHGHLDKLRAAHDLVAVDRAREGTEDAPLVHLGDLVDRGPDSAGVVEYLLHAGAADPRIQIIKGNHDRLFAWFLRSEPRHDPYLRAGLTYVSPAMGGLSTLSSYGIDVTLDGAALHKAAREAVPMTHRDFLEALPLTFAHDDALCVHAGLRPGVPLPDQTEEDLVWIRDDFHNDPRDHGALVIHGHTPVPEVEHHGNRLNLDTGAAYGGPLSTVAVEGRRAYLLTPSGRIRVPEIRG